ncbi:citryl-CoA lyase [Arthrobacter sp. FW306-2-2C-D06B]|uniref:citryl-CoA lyase n=1 Tax=Arthrobacter sp. FW306-2-2C-D06B TaxID=2879618 RepID=UPI001F2904B6|nr:citryl-CoA lyase [Arthrobacter sp. FW306-2-2C-D06B]UKA60456.1 citryl-CoA lyase [Arthrobacter sp. FW306-2-2C-D06B]
MYFSTTISEVKEGEVNLRGYSLAEIMRETTYADGAFLSITGRLPSPAERRLVDAILNSLLDHGFVASTITAARYIASGNPQFIPAVAGGILAAGSNTLSPEHSYHLLEHTKELRGGGTFDDGAERIVDEYVSSKRRLPGFGHPTHKTSDFRADILFELAAELGLAGDSVQQFQAIHAAFVRRTGKTNIPINIDGALAAIGCDLGWSANQTVAFAVLSVLPGLMAHVIEEIETGRPLRYIQDGDYIGKPMTERVIAEATIKGE